MAALFLQLVACEKPFEPEITFEANKLVVEGYIEASERNLPPLVILTRSQAFFTEIDAEQLESLFVHDAVVQVTHPGGTTVLEEICFSEIPPQFKAQFLELAGIEAEQVTFDFCLYTDLSFSLTGTEGAQYDLFVQVDEETLTATTTIPPAAPLDSLWFLPPPGVLNDTLAQLRSLIADPADQVNFYRYFTQTDGPMLPAFPSVSDDRLFNGQTFEFPLPRAQSRTAPFDPETFGLYRVDSTATLRWTTMDQDHFNFWNTLEFNAANQGPFSSYTQIDSNIDGGLGIWGGYAARYYNLVVQY